MENKINTGNKINDLIIQANSFYLPLKLDKERSKEFTGYASKDRPWLKYYYKGIDDYPMMGFYQYLYENNKDHLDDYALRYFEKKITYRELFKKVDILASSFHQMGIKENDQIPICSLTTPEMLIAILALNKIGAVSDLIDPRNGKELIKKYFQDSNSNVLITMDIFGEKLGDIIDETNIQNVITFSLGDSLPIIKRNILNKKIDKNSLNFNTKANILKGNKLLKNNLPPVTTSNYYDGRLAAIVYTGGSTSGESKKVLLSDDSFVKLAKQYACSDVAMKRGETFLSIIPPFFPYGICFSMMMPLMLGAEVILVPKFSAEDFVNLILKYKPNHTMGVPDYWLRLANDERAKRTDLSFLKIAGCGGTAISKSDQEKVNKFLTNHHSNNLKLGYGLTELASGVVCNLCAKNKVGSVGIPFVDTNVAIFDHDKLLEEEYEELPYGKDLVGEICIQAPTMMLGYDNKEETAKVIKKHPDGSIWFHTGDAGSMDEDGFLYIKDRYKRLILKRGQSIYPAQIEGIIMKSPYVNRVIVVPEDDDTFVHIPVAVIELKEEYQDFPELVIQDIQEICQNNLPEYSLPMNYYFVKEIPFTKMQKPDFHQTEENIKDKKYKKLVLKK